MCRHSLTLGLALVALAVWATGVELQVEYVRGLMWQEPWRWVTGQCAHFGGSHLGWNLAAFAVLGVFCESQSRLRFASAVGVSAVVVPGAVYLGCQGIETFRGLSGIDTALLGLAIVMTGCRAWRERRSGLAWLCGVGLAVLCGKTAFELATGSTVFVSGGGVDAFIMVPAAHLAGLVVGVVVGLVPGRGCGVWKYGRGWGGRVRRLMMPTHGRITF